MSSEIQESLARCNRSELVNLFDNSHKSELANNINSLKEELPTDAVIALLWCHVQAEEDLIPIPFIAGTISETLTNTPILEFASELCFVVCSKVAQLLHQAGEDRLSILILEPLIKSKTLGENRAAISEILKISLDKELIEAPKRKESKTYLNYLSSLQSISHNTNVNIDEAEVSIKNLEINRLSTNSQLSEPISDLMNLNVRSKERAVEEKKLFPIKIIIGIGLCGVFYGLWSIGAISKASDSVIRLFSSRLQGTLYSLNSEPNVLSPVLPPLPPYSAIEKETPLDIISERLSGLQTNSSPTIDPMPEETEKKPSKIKIDKEEIESLNVIPEANSKIPIKTLPSVAASKVPQPIDLGNSNKGAPIEEKSPEMKLDGRIYGQPKIDDPVAGKADERALDGSPLKSYEVEKFDPPVLFYTVTSTNVLSAPSLMSQSIARIEAKTTVRVTSIMGQWAEIRSNAGRLGYIFLKDLEKEERHLD
jgi:hypothetical protein